MATYTAAAELLRRVADFAERQPEWAERITYQTLPDEAWDLTLVSQRVYGTRDEFLAVMAAAGLDSVEQELTPRRLVLPTPRQLADMKRLAGYASNLWDRDGQVEVFMAQALEPAPVAQAPAIVPAKYRLPSVAVPSLPPPTCPYGSMYGYKALTVVGSTDGALTDFQVRVVAYKGSGTDTGDAVFMGSNVRDDFADVRFASADGSTELSYWRDQSTLVSGASCVFWVRLPSIPASPATAAFRVYYGDAALADASDIQATMLAGDDFRTMRRTHQVAGGAAPLFSTGITKDAAGVIYFTVWNANNHQHWLYKTADGGQTAPVLVSSFYATSSARSHSNLDTNGLGKFYACTMSTARTAIYLKRSTDGGLTWGSEVVVATGLTSIADPTPLYVSPTQLLIFVRVIVSGNFVIRCYESTNDGASWALKNVVYTVSTSGLNALEDIDAVVLPSGRILIAWEKEVVDELAASGEFVYTDDNAASYSAVSVSVPLDGTIDHEGGSFALRADGTLDMFYGSNDNGGSSYENQQLWRITYNEALNTWGPRTLANESYSGVENNAVYDAGGALVFTCTRQYDFTTPDMSTYILTMTRCVGDDWSDRGWRQDNGLAYALVGGAWVEGFTRSPATRGFLVFDGYSGGDAVIEALVSSPSPLTSVDTRIVFRFGSSTDHYMLTLLADGTNQAIWYKCVGGTYTMLQQVPFVPALNTLYRLVVTLRGANPTVLSLQVNGTAVLNNVTEATSSRTVGKIGISGGNAPLRRATLARHIFARKYAANPPTALAWSVESYGCGEPEPSVWRIPVTVPAGSVTAALAGFPVWISLASMPTEFWESLAFEDGRDLRVKTAAGADVPFDLVNIRPVERRGSLFVRLSLSNAAASTVYLHVGPGSGTDFVAPSAPNGRHAVWADFHRVYTLGPTPFDRTAGGAYPTQLTALGFAFERVSDSPNLGVHQGVAFDGTHYYVSDTNGLKKYTEAWVLVAENADPCGDVGGGVNHVGDIHVEAGVLYAPMEFYAGPSTVAFQKIAKFNASDLSLIGAVDVSAQGHECSSLAINPRDGLLYVSSFVDGTKLWKYNPATLAYVGQLVLSTAVPQIQGVAFWRDAIWLSEDVTDTIIRVELDGTVRNGVWGLGPGSPGNWEGLCARPDGLSALYDQTGAGDGIVLRLQHRNIAAAAGSRFFTTGVLQAAATRYTTWTMGATVAIDDKAENRTIVSYATAGSSDLNTRTTLSYRQIDDKIGIWNNTDGWLFDPLTTVLGTTYRYHVTHDGTAVRKLFRNGSLVGTDTTVTAQPPAGANVLIIGGANTAMGSIMHGKIGLVYLRAGVLPDAWLAAESNNLANPAAFYTVGAREAVA